MMIKSIYVHIPFCQSKCNYCDFNSFSLPVFKRRVDEYLSALKLEIELLSKAVSLTDVETLYFGGGTPTILETEKIVDLINIFKKIIDFTKIKEVTIEANPGTLNINKLYEIKNAGFNRLSIGVQSFNDRLLKSMGRVHNSNDAIDTVIAAKEAGFKNINIDLIYGLPNQTLHDWQEAIEKTLELYPDHISAYGLSLESSTPWGRLKEVGRLSLPDEDLVYEMYLQVMTKLKKNGFIHYEISNYCKPGKESLHNMTYWENNSYLGVGCGAASYYGNKRYYNTNELECYIEKLQTGQRPLKEVINLSREEIISETIFMNLRMLKGINLKEFFNKFHVNLTDLYENEINKLATAGLIKIEKDSLKLTSKGVPLANLVFCEFV